MTEKLKAIKIIHLSIVAGMIIVYVLLGDLATLDFLEIPEINAIDLIYIMLPILAVIAGNFIYKQYPKNIDKNKTLEEKLPAYQTATIIRLAILEGAAFIILFLQPALVLLGILLIGYMLYLRPTEEQFKRDFERNVTRNL